MGRKWWCGRWPWRSWRHVWRRRGEMQKHKSFGRELEAMKEAAGAVPLFGFYGSGEISCTAVGAPPKGLGYHIVACVLFAE